MSERRRRCALAAAAVLVAIPVAAGCGARRPFRVVRIGDQVWMAENLGATPPAGHAPHGDAATPRDYGLLYDWDAAQVACPRGWHLPSDDEWATLERTLGEDAGGKLKDTAFWSAPNTSATNASGFSARPAGYYNDQGFDDQFGRRAVYWTATRQDEHFVWTRVLSFDQGTIRKAPQHPQYGFSVRCVGDR